MSFFFPFFCNELAPNCSYSLNGPSGKIVVMALMALVTVMTIIAVMTITAVMTIMAVIAAVTTIVLIFVIVTISQLPLLAVFSLLTVVAVKAVRVTNCSDCIGFKGPNNLLDYFDSSEGYGKLASTMWLTEWVTEWVICILCISWDASISNRSIALERDKMTALWPNNSLTFTFYATFPNIITNWTIFLKEVFWYNV